MRRAALSAFLVILCAGCPKKDGAADAAPEASAAPVVSASAPPVEPTAKNASAVARFAGETKLANEKDKILADITIVREGPGTGTPVATLKKGADVTKIAKNGDYTLVLFTDPKAPSDWLMGWAAKSAFVASPPPRVCPKGQTLFIGVGCQVECTNGSCPNAMSCSGYGAKAGTDAPFPYCEASLDAGAPATTGDAGKPTAADAGHK